MLQMDINNHVVNIININRSVMPLIARSIFLLPNDVTEKYHLTAEDVYANRKQDSLRALVRELAHVSSLKYLQHFVI